MRKVSYLLTAQAQGTPYVVGAGSHMRQGGARIGIRRQDGTGWRRIRPDRHGSTNVGLCERGFPPTHESVNVGS